MKQYRITSADLNQDSPDDCFIPESDPIHELKILSGLGGLGGEARLHEYKAKIDANEPNITHTAAKLVNTMKEQNIQPGTPEWFKLWFSKPYLTGEKPTGK